MLPPDAWVAEHPDDVLDGLDGLMLAGGADIDPAPTATRATRRRPTPAPDRDRAEIALALRALERDMPVLGICRGMQLINVARGGTLIQHLPDDVGHTDHRRALGSFDNADHDVRLAPGSLAARAAARLATRPSPTITRPSMPWARASSLRVERARRPGRGDRDPRSALGPGRAVAPGGRPPLAAWSGPLWTKSRASRPRRRSSAALMMA